MSVIEKILSYRAEFVIRKHSLLSESKSADEDINLFPSLESGIVHNIPATKHDTKKLKLPSSVFEDLVDPDGSDEEILKLTTPVMMEKTRTFAYAKQGNETVQFSPNPKKAAESTNSFKPSSPFSKLHSIIKQNRVADQVSPLEYPSPVLSSRYNPDSSSENQSVFKMFRRPFLKPRIISLKQRLGFDEQDEKMKKLLAVKKIKKSKKKGKSFKASLYSKNVRMGWFEPILEDVSEESEEYYVENVENAESELFELSELSESVEESSELEKTDSEVHTTHVVLSDQNCNFSLESGLSNKSETICEPRENAVSETGIETEQINTVPPEESSAVYRIEISSNEISSPTIVPSSTCSTAPIRCKPDLNELRKPQQVDHGFLDPVILVNNRQSLRRARDHLKLRIQQEVPRRAVVKRNKKLRKRVKSGMEQVAGVFSKPKNDASEECKSKKSLFRGDLIGKATIHTKNTLSSLIGYSAEEKLI